MLLALLRKASKQDALTPVSVCRAFVLDAMNADVGVAVSLANVITATRQISLFSFLYFLYSASHCRVPSKDWQSTLKIDLGSPIA